MKRTAFRCWFFVLIGILAALLGACVQSDEITKRGNEKGMLAVDCEGWQEIEAFADNYRDGRLVIHSTTASYSYTGIRSPERGSEITGDTAVFLDCYGLFAKYPTYTWGDMEKAFCKDPVDTAYLVDALSGLNFSAEKSSRSAIVDATMVAVIARKKDDSWEAAATEEYFLCSDGTVLRGVESAEICELYESLERIDYYYFSALRAKHLTSFDSFYFECFADLKPSQYRLCLSSQSGHRDLTLHQARALLGPGRVGNWEPIPFKYVVNHQPPDLKTCIKITEYTQIEPGSKIDSYTVYIFPDGRLRSFRSDFGIMGGCDYDLDNYEYFEVFLQSVSEPILDYEGFIELIGP